MVSIFLFYFFSTLVLISSILVISTKKSIHSVLFLILSITNSSALFLMLNAELLAMLLIIIYAGALTVLFIFIVMMLNMSKQEKKQKIEKFLFPGLIIGVFFLAECLFLLFINEQYSIFLPSNINSQTFESNTLILGKVLYTDYFHMFQLTGMILLVSLIGAIMLTLRKQSGVKKQNIISQISRSKKDTIEIISVNTGEGA